LEVYKSTSKNNKILCKSILEYFNSLTNIIIIQLIFSKNRKLFERDMFFPIYAMPLWDMFYKLSTSIPEISRPSEWFLAEKIVILCTNNFLKKNESDISWFFFIFGDYRSWLQITLYCRKYLIIMLLETNANKLDIMLLGETRKNVKKQNLVWPK